MSITKCKIGFGTYKILDQNEMNNAIIAACKNKYDFIDTAFIYANEAMVGKALKIARKEKLFIPKIQTKIWVSQYKLDINNEIKKATKKLGVEVIDCILLHRPHVNMDINVKAWKGLIKAQKLGLVKEIGVSNFDRDQIELLYNETQVYPICNQIECSAIYFRPDRIVYNNSRNISIQAWRPMGLLEITLNNPLLTKLSKKYKCTVGQLLVAFANCKGTIPIVKSVNENRIKENKKSLSIKINKEDLKIIEEKLNRHIPTTAKENDSFANLSLNENWYKNN